MKFLIDANVLLEAALQRTNWQEAAAFLARTPSADLAVADFSVHAMGFYLIRKTPEVFDRIIADLITRNVPLLRLELAQLPLVMRTAKANNLDFDDAFVYALAELHNLIIVSLDHDFDRTPRGRRAPAAAI